MRADDIRSKVPVTSSQRRCISAKINGAAPSTPVTNSARLLGRLARFRLARRNGQYEHQNEMEIETLNAPGWRLLINLHVTKRRLP